jgi:hypothetical protein
VTVNAVLPGPTRSEGLSRYTKAAAEAQGVTQDVIEQQFLTTLRPTSLIKRFATTEEVANMVVYVCSEQASATTGAASTRGRRRRPPAGDKYFAWLVAVPEGAVTGTLTADGVTRQVTGSGYHDHNWGNVSPADLFDNWWWGRGRSGGHTIIASDIHGKASVGGTEIPLFFVGDEHGVQIDAYGLDVKTVEGGPVRHPDPNHERPIGSGISFSTADGSEAEFRISDRLLTSNSLLSNQSFVVKIAAAIMGKKPCWNPGRIHAQARCGLQLQREHVFQHVRPGPEGRRLVPHRQPAQRGLRRDLGVPLPARRARRLHVRPPEDRPATPR